MDATEDELTHALVAMVGGTRLTISTTQVLQHLACPLLFNDTRVVDLVLHAVLPREAKLQLLLQLGTTSACHLWVLPNSIVINVICLLYWMFKFRKQLFAKITDKL
jgi:hypothetical protein